MKISDLANSFFQWPAISFPYVEFPSALSQQTFVLGVSSSQRRSYGLMRIPFKKADLAVRLVFRYLLNCGREVVDSSVDDLACLRRHTDETPARFSSRLPSCGASRYKAPFPLLTKLKSKKRLRGVALATRRVCVK